MLTWLLLGLFLVMWGASEGLAADASGPQLTAIDVSGNTVRVSASGMVKHSVVANTDPFKAIIELEGVGPGQFKGTIRPEKSIVVDISASEANATKPATLLVMTLSSPAQVGAETRGNSLEVVFTETSATQPAPVAAVSSGALREINDVLLDKTDAGVELIIKTDGRVKEPVVYDVDGKLIIDVPSAVMKAAMPAKMLAPVRDMKYRVERDRVRFIVEPSVVVDAQATVLDDELIIDIKPATAVKKGKSGLTSEGELPLDVKKKTISLDFQNADIVPILRLLGDVSGYNMVIHPDVKGQITMKLKNAPWDQALDIILKTFNLQKTVEGNTIRVMTAKAYQDEKRAIADAREVLGRADDVTTKVFVVNNANLEKVKEAVDKGKILSPRGSLSSDSRTRSLVVKDIPSAIEEVRSLIEFLDKPTPQVLIDARMVEVNTNFSRELGIEWSSAGVGTKGYLTGSQSATGILGGFTRDADNRLTIGSLGSSGVGLYKTVNLPTSDTPAGAISFGIFGGNSFALEARISAIESTGKGKVVSNPKILTVDNEEAIIKHGAQIPVTTRTQDGTFSTQYKDANLKLTVTPQISPDNTVYMKIEVTKDEPDFSRTDSLGNPTINSRQAKTQLYLKDGETVVIGGILKTNESDNEKNVPGLSKIPLLGLLFKNSAVSTESQELLIFITPRIVKR
ncbi:MAG TPA: type IV pilus secretin PilQ [Dissulfurispiraceae bacterium]|nr:type IV pilus secretin PilQ [Dissulfurispiraceae bacterium]